MTQKAYETNYIEVLAILETLPKRHKDRVSRRLEELFQRMLQEAVSKRTKEQRADLHKRQKEAEERMGQAAKLKAGVQAFMAPEEYRLVLSCLHPDRECEPERKNRAFVIFKRLEKTNLKVK